MKELVVLFLDDEESILNSLSRLLINEPFGIAMTSDHKEALAILAREKIKVIFSDERMPNISGVEFLGQVKQMYPDIIRVLFTGYADISAAENAINVGEVYRFINKPWNPLDLKKTICQAIEHYDLIVENRKLFEATQRKNEELEALTKKLKDMNEIQKEFTSTISHELRTPLSSIKTAIDIVVSETSGPLTKTQGNFLGKAKDNVDRLSRLINDILDLTKLESGKLKVNIQHNDIIKIIRQVTEIHEYVAKNQGLYLKVELDPTIPVILFDSDRINQLLSNLISNAIKFTEQGGVVVTAKNQKQANHIEICIRDTGVGITREEIPQLFQKFQQLGDPATRKTGGTGLGLAICKEIIQQHGGKIWVESEYQRGSSFYFSLPIEERRKE